VLDDESDEFEKFDGQDYRCGSRQQEQMDAK
jgi:hypothetical protein